MQSVSYIYMKYFPIFHLLFRYYYNAIDFNHAWQNIYFVVIASENMLRNTHFFHINT